MLLQASYNEWAARWSGTQYLGLHASNNRTEYAALCMGLRAARRFGIKHLVVNGDSQLIITQIRWQAAVRRTTIKQGHDTARDMLEALEFYYIHHAYLANNTMADFLANRAMDSRKTSNTEFG